MTTSYKNRLVCTVSAVASSGLGAFTVSTASSGYATFAAGDDAKTFDIVAVEGTAWEVRTGCTYTHSGTSLSRGTLEASSTGSAIAFTTAATLTVTPSAAKFGALELAMQAVIPGGRLTLESGVPVSTTDQTAKTTVYYTPCVHNVCALWDGVNWRPVVFAETSLALGTLTSGKPYDVFAYLSSGVLALEMLAWTDGTTRATAVTLQDGRYCKSGDKTRLLLGSFYTTATTTTEDSLTKRFLVNLYNKVTAAGYTFDNTGHTYNSTTVRYWNNSSTNKIEFLSVIGSSVVASVYGSSNSGAVSGIWPPDTQSGSATVNASTFGSTGGATCGASYSATVAAGYHYIGMTEYSASGSTVTYYGANMSIVLER